MRNRVVPLVVFCSFLLAVRAAASAAAPPKSPDFRKLYEKCAPSVVMVTAVETVPRGLAKRTIDLLNPFPIASIPGDVLSFVFYPLRLLIAGPLKAGGSGIIIDEQGHFITNHHVVEVGNVFWAELHDRRLIRATLIGSDQDEDYALLKLRLKPGEKVVPAKLGDSSQLRHGETVFAIGSPLRLRHTLTVGVVAGLERRMIGPFQDFIQTDLTIGAGSSGGALFNARGEVVGITTLMHAVFEETGDITLSIPIDYVREGLDQLKSAGKVTRGFIGVHVKDVTPRLIKEFKLAAKSGACVTEVARPRAFRKPPARAAGIRPGDVIVRYETAKKALAVDRARTLARAVLNTAPGTRATITFLRGKTEMKAELTVRER